MVLEFEVNLRGRAHLGFISLYVMEFVSESLRCFKCQRMGHVAGVCRGQRHCMKCEGPHEYGKCGVEVKARFCNCVWEHSAAFGCCIVLKQEAEILRYKITNKVAYAEAARRIQSTEPGKRLAQRRRMGGKGVAQTRFPLNISVRLQNNCWW